MEPEIIGRLIDRQASALVLFARQLCDAPEDVVQEAFVKLASLDRPQENPAAWLFRVVRNGAVDASLATRRRRRYETEAAERSTAWFDPADGEAKAGVDPIDAERALAALPIAEREVIVARLWGGLTFEQIAEALGTSSSSAHRLYNRGLAVLRERLGVRGRGVASFSGRDAHANRRHRRGRQAALRWGRCAIPLRVVHLRQDSRRGVRRFE